MKILFVAGKTVVGIAPFVESQKQSLLLHGCEVDVFLITNKTKNPLGQLLKLRKKIISKQYDIVHSHHVHYSYWVLLTFTKTKKVLSFLGSDLNGKPNKNGKTTIKGRFNKLISRLILPFVQGVIVKSERMKHKIPLPFHKKTIVLPNGVDFDSFFPMDLTACRKKLNLPHEKKIILFTGNPTDINKNFHLLKTTVNKLNNPEIQICTPFPSPPELMPFYINSADVVVLTSFYEGSPNIIKEALACNTKIISTDVGDVKENISNTNYSFIIQDKNNFEETLIQTLNLPLKTNGRENIKHLDSKKIGKTLIDFYKKVLN
ncbi:MAG: hypothetical protein A2W91_07230 [Bacteroidetes bacterium GWF2_38_335]|nr:MAG: hypothetical protein A2W91_07230 [Bacteroidetes bacterium GWF2_38_335]OFY77120.1 MAG: hypothetical protein A2281_14465 [Bacteroidetes bacterium RIFOXYA12_FULL_38_20]HBS85011.1 hypothetical protein [Bacteroidales bacterium]